jgi:hypothetical protein
MKKVSIILALMISAIVVSSCTPEALAEEVETQACCGKSGEIPPPPPPPPPGDGD